MFDVEIYGDGRRDLVLLYGTPVPEQSLEPLPREFAGDFRVIVPQTAAIGIDCEEALGRLEQTLADAGVENPVVLGHSLGAYRALQLALSDAIDVEKMVLMGPLANMPDDRYAQYEELAAGLEAGEVDITDVALEFFFRPETIENTPELRELVDGWMGRFDDEELVDAVLVEVVGPDLHPHLGDIDVPACVLVGEYDAGTPPEWAEEIADRIPDASLEVIDDVGHFPNLVKPEPTLRAIREFLG